MDNRRPGDWDCLSCNQMNFASRNKCFKCGQFKTQTGGFQPAPVGNEQIPYGMPQGQYPTYNAKHGYGYYAKNKNIKEGDWFCACGGHNYAFRNDCFRCHKAKTEGDTHQKPQTGYFNQGHNNFKPGDWVCTNETCQFHNFANRDKCLKCGSDKPPQALQ